MKFIFNHSKLRGRIKEKLGSEKKFSELLGLSANTITLKLNGERYFTQPEIKKITDSLEISPEEIPSYFFTQEVRENRTNRE